MSIYIRRKIYNWRGDGNDDTFTHTGQSAQAVVATVACQAKEKGTYRSRKGGPAHGNSNKRQGAACRALAKLEGPYGIYAQRRPQWETEVTKTPNTRWDAEWRARQEILQAAMKRGIEEGEITLPSWPQTTRLDVEAEFAERAANDRAALDAELGSMQVRTSIIMTIATVLFAVYTLSSGENKSPGALVGLGLLGVALLLNGTAFVCAISPLAPPFRRAWKGPYDKRHIRNLIVRDSFTAACYDNWLGERRTPIITKYKKMHSLAVPLLKWAAFAAIPGIMLSFIFP